MPAHKSIAVLLLLALSACAEVRAGTVPHGDDGYVEIANPAATMSPGAPATIWVPRKSLGSGVPRGSTLMGKGFDAIVSAIGREPQTDQAGGAETPPAPYHHDSYR